MRLFPTVHATGDLPAAHRAHLERHGLTLVGRDDDPDVTLVLPGTDPVETASGAGVVVLLSGEPAPAVSRLLASQGIAALSVAELSTEALVPADPGGDDLLAWTSELRLPVRAT